MKNGKKFNADKLRDEIAVGKNIFCSIDNLISKLLLCISISYFIQYIKENNYEILILYVNF